MSLILDNATPMLNELLAVSHGYAMDGINYASVEMQNEMKRKARSCGRSEYGTDFSTGRRRLRGSKQSGEKASYFSRSSKTIGGEIAPDMAEFIKFQASDITMKSVIGFINVKGFNASLYKNGRKTGSKYVKGQGGAKGKVGVKEIGEKLEHGGREDLSEKQKGFFKASGWVKAAERGYVMRTARPVVNPVFRSMQGQITGIFQDKYAKAIVKHVANMNVKTRKVG